MPQGSVLGPLCFAFYINDLAECVNANCHLYVDDTTIYCSNKSILNIQLKLQSSLNNVLQWSQTTVYLLTVISPSHYYFERGINNWWNQTAYHSEMRSLTLTPKPNYSAFALTTPYLFRRMLTTYVPTLVSVFKCC